MVMSNDEALSVKCKPILGISKQSLWANGKEDGKDTMPRNSYSAGLGHAALTVAQS